MKKDLTQLKKFEISKDDLQNIKGGKRFITESLGQALMVYISLRFQGENPQIDYNHSNGVICIEW